MKFIQISDLHYNPETDGRLSRELRKELPIYIRKNNLQADELFVTGDYRHAKLQEFESIESAASKAVQLIWEIAQAAGISDANHIHLIPGNHDRDRSSNDEDIERVQRIREKYSSEVGRFDKSDLLFLKEQFKFFYAVCEHLYTTNNPWDKHPLHTFRITGHTVLLYLNTAIMHNTDADRGSLIIGNDEVGLLLDKIAECYPQHPIIVLAHHGLEFFEKNERETVEQLLRSRLVMLYLCGDAHAIWWRSVNGYTEITMGCLKSSDGTQATFLYGNATTKTYEAYHWDGKFGQEAGWGPYTQFNKSITCNQKRLSITPRMIQRDQELLKNEVLLPWMKHSVSYKTLFPKLFIHPLLISGKNPGKLSYSGLLSQYKNKNIAIVSDAGFGKSTLLRHTYLVENKNFEFLYLKASTLRKAYDDLSLYERVTLALLTGEKKSRKHRIILLDSMDEAFVDSPKELQEFIMRLSKKNLNIAVWFGWRAESYYRQETVELQRFLDNIVSLKRWNEKMIAAYVRRYFSGIKRPDLLEQFYAVSGENEAVKDFLDIPFHLTLVLYLIENKNLSVDIWRRFEMTNSCIYSLYRQFFLCWIKKEKHRATSYMTESAIETELHRIARELYYGNDCIVTCEDTAITDFLVFDNSRKEIATGFYHRSLCAFFYADSIFVAIKDGGAPLVRALSHPLKNDITDFVRSAIETIQSEDELCILQKNLMDTYQQATKPQERLLHVDVCEEIAALPGENLFYLKNELVYLIARLPPLVAGVDDFVAQAYKEERDSYMKLDLAYGAVLTGPSWVGLDYARSLMPGSEADLVNRSWTLAFFGDVQANPYYYRDDGVSEWKKARDARLKRFQSSKIKAVRFRILDFPLMYCFYESRNWINVNEKDFKIIQSTSVDNLEYSEDEKKFLAEQKEKLVLEYEKRLICRGKR